MGSLSEADGAATSTLSPRAALGLIKAFEGTELVDAARLEVLGFLGFLTQLELCGGRSGLGEIRRELCLR